jgi:hypothetical protein
MHLGHVSFTPNHDFGDLVFFTLLEQLELQLSVSMLGCCDSLVLSATEKWSLSRLGLSSFSFA